MLLEQIKFLIVCNTKISENKFPYYTKNSVFYLLHERRKIMIGKMQHYCISLLMCFYNKGKYTYMNNLQFSSNLSPSTSTSPSFSHSLPRSASWY